MHKNDEEDVRGFCYLQHYVFRHLYALGVELGGGLFKLLWLVSVLAMVQ